jgi:hypothetical protein
MTNPLFPSFVTPPAQAVFNSSRALAFKRPTSKNLLRLMVF